MQFFNRSTPNTTNTPPATPFKLKPTSLMMAVEPRIMFDGAAVTAAAEIAHQYETADHSSQQHGAIGAVSDFDLFVKTNSAVDARSLSAATSQDNAHKPSNISAGTQHETINLTLSHRTEVVFIESNVPDIQLFIQSIDSSKEVYILDAAKDGLHQMASILAGRANIDAVHIISHGSNASVNFGALTLGNSNIDAHAADLQMVGRSLKAGGDILLYGCDIAATNLGASFIDKLALVTGADTAASNNLTGNAKFSADWNLEVKHGNVEAQSVVTPEVAGLYMDVLSINSTTVTFESAADILDGGGHKYSTQDITYQVNGDSNYKFVISGTKTGMEYARNNVYKNSYVQFDPYNAYKTETAIALNFVKGQIFTPTGLDIDNSGSKAQSLVFTGFAADGTTAIKTQNVSLSAYTQSNSVSLTGFTDVSTLKITATSNSGTLRFFQFDNIAMSNIKMAVTDPTISSATYNASTNVLSVTAADMTTGDTILPSKLTIKGENDNTYILTSSSVTASSATAFSITLNADDQLAVEGLLNKTGTLSNSSGTTFNLSAASGWDSDASSAPADSTNLITVSSVSSPVVSTADYDASTGVLTVTGSGFVATSGSPNDITVSNLTLKGQGGGTHTLTSSNVEASSPTSFSVTLNAVDQVAVNGLLNQNGGSSLDSTTYNIAAATGWDSALASADTSNAITVSNVTGPVVSSATYNANTGTLVVTGTNFVGKVGATNDITVGNLTLKGENGNTYTLTSSDVELGSATQFTVALNAVDKTFINGLVNKTGTKAVDSTTYNISASSGWDTALASADTTNGITASNIQTPTITSATYNNVTGVLNVTGTNLVATVGSNNDIIISTMTLKGLGNSTYTLTSNDVDITSATSFSITLNSTDIAGLAAILNKNGTKASDNVTYNLEAEDDWNSDINDTDIADTTATVTVTTPAPSVTKAVQTSGNGYYKAGDTVTFDVYFDQNVTVNVDNGTPRILLETGDNDQYADYTAGSGGKILSFSYVVGVGDTSSDLQYFDTSSFELNFGTLTATSDNLVNATLTLPGLASGNSLGELSSVIIDTTAPSSSTPDMTSGSDSGSSSSDDITNDTTPDFTGTAEANSTVTLYDTDGTTSLGTTTADGSGIWSITSSKLSEGDHTVKTTVTDAAGNVSGFASQLITIDTTAPSAPTGVDLAAGSDSGYSNSDNVTNKTTLVINGKAEANATVKMYDTDGTTVAGTATTNNSGKWSITTNTMSEAEHTLTVKAIDIAGNASKASSSLKVTVDTTAPSGTPVTPVLDSSSDSGNSNSDGITYETSPTLSGTDLETGGYVQIYEGNNLLATTQEYGSGSWETSVNGLSEGTYAIIVKAFDLAGNANPIKSSSLTVAVDTTAPNTPNAPDLTSGSDTGSSNSDDITSTATPTFTGVAEDNAAIKLYDSDGTTEIGSTTADGSGNWSITASTMSEATHTVTVKATDLAGNVSNASSALTVTIDMTAPTVLVDTLKFSNDTGSSSTDFITKTAAQTISGTVDTNLANDETVQVSIDNGSTWQDATAASGQKTWSLSGVTLSSSNTLKVRVVDSAGNSGTVASQAYVLDQSAPSAPTTALDSSSDTGTSNSDSITKTVTPVISGTSEANASLTLYDTDGTTVLGTTTADGSGNWSITSDTLSEGAHILVAKASDTAGNTSVASSDLEISIDTTAPTASAPDLNSGSDSGRSNSDDITSSTTPGFSGKAEVGSAVKLYDTDGSTLLGTATADGSGNWAITSSKLSEGTHTVSIKTTDVAGNVSSASSALSVMIDTTVPTTAALTVDTVSDSGVSSSDSITNVNQPTFTGTLEAYANVNLFDTNGKTVLGTTTADSLGNWSVTVTQDPITTLPLAGTHNITVVATDKAGNVSSKSTATKVVIDTTAPALKSAITISDTALKIGDTATATFKFTEAISGFTTADLKVENGKVTSLSSSDGGITWTGTLTPTASITDTTNMITLDNTGYTDVAGNAGVGTSNSPNYAIDTVRPSLASAITISDTALKIGDTATVTFVFTEAITGFTAADVTVPNGVLSNLTTGDGGITWTATLTPNASAQAGTNVLTLDLTGVQDLSGNAGSGNDTSGNYAVDTLRPSLASSITISDTNLAIGETATVTFTFNEAINGFTIADLTVDHGAVSNLKTSDGGITWTGTLTPSASVTDATNIITLDYTGITDNAGNAGTGTVDSPNYAIDSVRPDLASSITVSDTALKIGDTATVTVTFTEAVTGFTTADVTVDNGVLSNLTTSDGGITWTATLTPSVSTSDTTNILTLDKTGITDPAGNAGLGSDTSGNYSVDTSRPSLASSITLSDTALKIGDTATVTFTFTEAVSGFTIADVTVPNGVLSNLTTGDGGITWTATLTPDASTTAASNVLTLDYTGITDLAGNAGSGSDTSGNYAVDTVRPSLASSITISDTALKIGDAATVTFTFTEAVSSFTTADVTVPNGVLSNLTTGDGGITWTATLTPNASAAAASNVLTLDNTGVTDLAGNVGSGNVTSGNYAVDTVRPSLASSITISDTALKIGDTATVTFTFTEAVSGFTIADVTVPNGVLSNLSTSDGGVTWTSTLTPNASATAASNVLTLDNTGIADLAGNAGTGNATSGNYAVDTVRPSLASSITISDTALKIDDTATVTFTFTEAVGGFTIADVTVPNGVLSNLTTGDGGITWTSTLTPNASAAAASNVLTLDYTGIADLAGNAGTGNATSGNYAVDTVRPSLASSITISDTALKIGDTATVTFTFTEAVSGFTIADVTVPNGVLSNLSTGDGGVTWTSTLTPNASATAASNVLTLDNTGVTDLTGNAGSGNVTSGNYAVDTVRPSLASSITISDTALKIGDTATVAFTFTEAVSGFTIADVTVPNGVLSNLSTGDGGITWTATLTPNASATGASNVLTLDYTGTADLAGNAGTGNATSGNYAVDTVRPSLASSITISDTALKIGDMATVTFTFTEAVSGFTIADVTVPNGVLSNLSTDDSGITWTSTLTPSATAASNVLTLDYTGIADLAGNAGTGNATSGNYAIDTVRPSLASSITISDTALKIGDTATVTFTFTEAVTGFTIADVTVPNGVLSNLATGDGGITWTSTLTPNASATTASNVLTLDNTGIADLAGNAGTGNATSGNYTVDTVRPSLASSITISDTALQIGDTATVTFTFTEAVSGFTIADVTVPNGVLSNLTTVDGGITWTSTLTPNASATAASNVLTLDNTGIADLAGNAGTGNATSGNYAVDTVRPSLASSITISNTALKIGDAATVTFTFTEAVSGFTIADVTVPNGILSNLSTGDGGITWTATLTPNVSATAASNVLTLDYTGIANLAGNAGTGNATSGNYAVDTVRPTATIVVADTDLGIDETTQVTITFSEAITEFTNADLSIEHGTLSPVSSSDGGITWTATLTPSISTLSSINLITLDKTGVIDSAGNAGEGSTLSNQYAVNTVIPAITSVTYDAGTGMLFVIGRDMATGDTIASSKLTLTGEGGATYTLTSSDVTASSSTEFSIVLNAADKAILNEMLNKEGTHSTGGTIFNLSAADDWDANLTVRDTSDVTNGLTVQHVVVPTITQAAYDAATGTLNVSGTGFLKLAGSFNDIDVSKLTLSGAGGNTYTLTSSNIEITNGTSFTVALNNADKAAVNRILHKDGQVSSNAGLYNLAAAEDWAKGADASVLVADLTGNNVAVNHTAPTVSGSVTHQFTNDNTPLNPFASFIIEDTDSTQTQTLTVTLDIAAKGALSNLSGGSYTANTGIYSFTGTASQAQAAIRALVYTPAPNRVNPGLTDITTFMVSVNDGVAPATVDSITTVVTTSVNTAPVITSNGAGDIASVSIAENTTGVTFVTAIDSDLGDSKIFNVVGGADQALFAINPITGALYFVASPDFETPRDAGRDNTYEVIVEVADGQGGIDRQTLNVTVTDVAEVISTITPTLRLVTGSDTGISDSDNIINTPVVTLTGTAEAGSTVTLSNRGTALGTIVVGLNGQWTISGIDLDRLIDNANDPAPGGVYTLSAQTTNKQGGVSEAVTLSIVLDTTPPPSPISLILDPASDSAPVGDQRTTLLNVNFKVDLPVGANAGDRLVLNADIDGNGSYEKTVATPIILSTADILSGSFLIAVDASTFPDQRPVSFRSVLIDVAGNASVSDPIHDTAIVSFVTDFDGITPATENGGGGDFNEDGISDSLQSDVATTPLVKAKDFTQASTGNSNGVTYGAIVAGDNAGTGVPEHAGSIQLRNVLVTPAVESSGRGSAVLQNIVSQGLGAATDIINFTAVANAHHTQEPDAEGFIDADTHREGTQVRFTINLGSEGVAATRVIKVRADGSTFDYTATSGDVDGGQLIDTNHDGRIDRIILTITDNGVGDINSAIGVIDDPVFLALPNDAPALVSHAGQSNVALNISESSQTITTVQAVDNDHDTLTYSISGGADQSKFVINSSTGELSFIEAQTVETPTDSDHNDRYRVIVTASDGKGGVVTQELSITVMPASNPIAPNIARIHSQFEASKVTHTLPAQSVLPQQFMASVVAEINHDFAKGMTPLVNAAQLGEIQSETLRHHDVNVPNQFVSEAVSASRQASEELAHRDYLMTNSFSTEAEFLHNDFSFSSFLVNDNVVNDEVETHDTTPSPSSIPGENTAKPAIGKIEQASISQPLPYDESIAIHAARDMAKLYELFALPVKETSKVASGFSEQLKQRRKERAC